MEIEKKNLRTLSRIKEFLTDLNSANHPEIKDIDVKFWNDSDSFIINVYYDEGTKKEDRENISDEIWRDLYNFLDLPIYVSNKTI